MDVVTAISLAQHFGPQAAIFILASWVLYRRIEINGTDANRIGDEMRAGFAKLDLLLEELREDLKEMEIREAETRVNMSNLKERVDRACAGRK